MAENIHRKNLTQIEEAKKIQRDLDKLGSVDAVLEKHQKAALAFQDASFAESSRAGKAPCYRERERGR
ncbi:hypothetical protein [Xylella fastidiosa]|nr:hypothetical protein [Xylella fastidiosa]